MTDRDHSRGDDYRKFSAGCPVCRAEVGSMHRDDCVFKDVRVSPPVRVAPAPGPTPVLPHRDDPASWPPIRSDRTIGPPLVSLNWAVKRQGKHVPTAEEVARTALHILEVQGADAVKDFLTRTIELEASRKFLTGNT